MRLLTVLALTIFVANATIHPKKLDKKGSVEQEISEALKDIEESRKIILNENESESRTFLSSMENTVSGLWKKLPFTSTGDENGPSLLSRTQNEVKEDIEKMRGYLGDVRVEFDEWVISNHHRQFRSILLGGLSAALVLIVYFYASRWWRARSGHISGFVNKGFVPKTTRSLMPPKEDRMHYSLSDDEV